MNSLSRLAENLGAVADVRFLAGYIGIRTTRTHLLARGLHIDLSTLAQQTGFRVPVFFKRQAFQCLTEKAGQFHDAGADLYDAMLELRQAMMKAPLRDCPVLFQAGELTLVAYPGRLDHDDPRPALTVALASNQDANVKGGQDDE
jgi:hypothetical protein